MHTRLSLSPSLVLKMRDDGKGAEIGAVELDLMSGSVTWVNEYALERLGYTLDQIQSMSVFDLVPEFAHGALQDMISDKTTRKSIDTHALTRIWPLKTTTGKIVWWAIMKSRTEFPIIWAYGNHIQTTPVGGMSYSFMQAFMNAVNNQAGMSMEVTGLKEWATSQIERLDEADHQLKARLVELEGKMEETIAAAKLAASMSTSTNELVRNLKDSVDKFEGELLKLIGTDSVHDKRIDAFEKHMQMTTSLAVKSIEMQAAVATKGMSKKIVIPVSVIAAIVALIQFLLEHYWK